MCFALWNWSRSISFQLYYSTWIGYSCMKLCTTITWVEWLLLCAGVPDGMTVDANGKLWVVLCGGGAVIQIDPETNSEILCVELPVKCPTSVAFGGSLLSIPVWTVKEPSFLSIFATCSTLIETDNSRGMCIKLLGRNMIARDVCIMCMLWLYIWTSYYTFSLLKELLCCMKRTSSDVFSISSITEVSILEFVSRSVLTIGWYLVLTSTEPLQERI